MNQILLVEPAFPYPAKSKNKANEVHKNFVPVGLLKIGAYYKSIGCAVKLVRGNHPIEAISPFAPGQIMITSIFTYWSKYVWDAVEYYRGLFPDATIIVGGIYATIHSDKQEFQNKLRQYNARCHIGLYDEAERFYPDYSLLGSVIDYHATHAMRGCIRKCGFCGTWKIEPKREDKTTAELIAELKAIGKNRVIFFDNNFLANKQIKQILEEVAALRINNRPIIFESQSGFDGRLLEKEPELAKLLKKARFQNVRIAWDNAVSDSSSIKKQIDSLADAGYKAKDISVFMIYNFGIPFENMLKKLTYCKKWGVQITDCRFRPLDITKDDFKPHKFKEGQSDDEYYVHKRGGWTDRKIRDFRKKVREHNIWVRYAKDKGLAYDRNMEKWSSIHNTFKFFKLGRPPKLEDIEKSPTWINRLYKLNKVKNYYRKNGFSAPDFNKLPYYKIDEELNKMILVVMDSQRMRKSKGKSRGVSHIGSASEDMEIAVVEGKG